MIVMDLVREEALVAGVTMSDADLIYVLWEHTGFPSFWDVLPGETPEACLRRQLREYFKQARGDPSA